MKPSFLILALLIFVSSFSQDWKKIPKSSILFSELIKKDKSNWYEYTFEFFKRGDRLLMAQKNLADDLYQLFLNDPFVFDSLYNQAQIKSVQFLDELKNTHEILKNETINSVVVLSSLKIIIGDQELIWSVMNTRYYIADNPCFINIIFKRDRAKGKNKFLSLHAEYCEI